MPRLAGAPLPPVMSPLSFNSVKIQRQIQAVIGDIEIIDTIYYYKDVVRFNDITTNAVLNIYGLTGYVGGPIDFSELMRC